MDTALKAPEVHHAAAMAAGARCDLCPLRNCGAGPVPPSVPAQGPIDLLVVAEAPGQAEVDEGHTLIGPSGREIRAALRVAGFDPARASYTNTMLCRPPDDLERYLQQLRRRKEVSPIECCRPRLQAELARARFAILMGGASLSGVGLKSSIMKVRGTPVQVPDGPPAVPILHAAFVLRDKGRTFRHVFRTDVAKAIRIAAGGNTWKDPAYFIADDPIRLANFLARPRNWWAVDTETDGIDPWTCRLRRIGIGTKDEAAIFAPLSVKGHPLIADPTPHYRVLAEHFARPTRFAFHNWFGFDSIVLAQHGLRIDDGKVQCSLIGHHIGPTSELPHGLDFLGSMFTDAPYWKGDVKHTTTKDDGVLDRYLSFDVAVTWIAAPYVRYAIEASQQAAIYNLDAYLGAVGRSMAALGIVLDREKQFAFATEYQEKADRLAREFKEVCGRDVNPRSPVQVRKFLYSDLGLPALEGHETDSGEPSTAEPVLLELLGLGVDKRAEKVIHTLLGFREADKLLSTYTGHVARLDEDGNVCAPHLVDGPPVHADGRLRTSWKVHGTVSGRWSSGDPVNMQNIPKKLRAMYKPAPGNVFVAADFSALELRILALLAEDEILIEAFRAFDAGMGPDIHVVNACTVFSCKPEQVTDEPRTFAKRFVYGLSYGAGPPKIHQTMSLLRDDNLNPVFPNITLAEIERVYKIWWEAHPAIVKYRKNLIGGWRRRGYIGTPWHDRRRFFLAGEDREEMYNFPIQGGAADLQNSAVKTFVDAYPFDLGKRSGLVLQVHDQLVAECPAGEAERVKQIMEWAMAKKIGPMLFPAKAKIGKDWKEVS